MQLMLSYLKDRCLCNLWVALTWAQGLSYNFRKKRHTLCPSCQRAAASTLPSGIISAHSTAFMGSFSRRQVLFKPMWDGRVK